LRLRAAEPENLVIVRHAPTLDGRMEGSLQQLNAETVDVHGTAVIRAESSARYGVWKAGQVPHFLPMQRA
jgi:hypothetical protein